MRLLACHTCTLATVMVCLQLGFPQSKPGAAAEQSHFSAEDEEVRRAIEVPAPALDILRRDPRVAEAIKGQGIDAANIPKSWFLASEVHLAGPEERDVVVVGVGRLAGANVTTFWVFRPRLHGFELLLKASAHDLAIRSTRTNGYRDIETLVATAVQSSRTVFRFDGNRYAQVGRD